jgi:hypothetical protein
LSCISGYILDVSNNCAAVTVGTSTAPVPITMLSVKTYYVSSQALQHVLYSKQGYRFTRQTINWSSVTSILLYNSAASSTIALTINSVEWSKDLTSIIYITNNPLNLTSSMVDMPFKRLLLTQE